MEELQSAVQGAVAHCKNSMMQKQDRDQWRNQMHSSDLIKSWSVS
jgi:hypothetical protein